MDQINCGQAASRCSVNYPEGNHRAKLCAWFIDTRQAILFILKP